MIDRSHDPRPGASSLTVLVALDESASAARAAERAVTLFGSVPGVSFLALNVANLPLSYVGVAGFGAVGPLVLDPRWLEEAHPPDEEARRAVLARAQAVGLPHPQVVVEEGDPVRVICDVADQVDADVIVVGSHDRSLLGRLFDPPVADAVVHRSARPVLVVSGDEDSTSASSAG